MLSPQDSKNLVDLLTPPVGYRLHRAIGTSYSVDFTIVTAILMALIESGVRDEKEIHPAIWFRAFQKNRENIAIFCNRGRISSPSINNRLIKLYDTILYDVSWTTGSFHPKLWVLGYRPLEGIEGKPLYRVLCSSRNLTKPNNWEVVVCLDGERQRAHTGNNALVKFLSQRIDESEMKPSKKDFMNEFINELMNVRFVPPNEFEEVEVLCQDNGVRLLSSIPQSGKKCVVVSPFLGTSAIGELRRRFGPPVILSTQKALDSLSNSEFDKLNPNDLYTLVDPLEKEDDHEKGLHAKIVIVDTEETTKVYAGSANITANGWFGANAEAMVHLQGTSYTTKRFLNEFLFKEKDVLHGWIERYSRNDVTENEDEKVKNLLDVAQQNLSSIDINLFYDKVTLTLTADISPSNFSIDPHLSVFVQILDLGPQKQLNTENSATGLRWTIDQVSVGALTPFILYKVFHEHANEKREFLVIAKNNLADLEFERTSAFLESLSQDNTNIIFLLRAIIFDDDPYTLADVHSRGSRHSGDGSGTSEILMNGITLEDLLKVCVRNREKMKEVGNLVALLEKGAGTRNEFQQLIALWKNLAIACGNEND